MKPLLLLTIFIMTIVTTPAQAQDEKQVASAVERLRLAMINADKNELEKLTAKELSYGHSSGNIEDQSAFIESLTSGKSDFVSIELKDQTISVIGNTALVRHKLYGEINDGGKAGSVAIGILLVWQKQKGQWKLIGRQAFRLPV